MSFFHYNFQNAIVAFLKIALNSVILKLALLLNKYLIARKAVNWSSFFLGNSNTHFLNNMKYVFISPTNLSRSFHS